jgi:hypothetical protein
MENQPILTQNPNRKDLLQQWVEQENIICWLQDTLHQYENIDCYPELEQQIYGEIREAHKELRRRTDVYMDWHKQNDPAQFVKTINDRHYSVKTFDYRAAIKAGWTYVGYTNNITHYKDQEYEVHTLDNVDVVEVWRTFYKEYIALYTKNNNVQWFVMTQEQLNLVEGITPDFKELLNTEAKQSAVEDNKPNGFFGRFWENVSNFFVGLLNK